MDESIKTFVRFLKESGYYHKYMRNFKSLDGIKYRFEGVYGCDCDNVNDFLNMFDCNSYIDHAFNWFKSNEGFRYWRNVHKEWYKVLGGRKVIKI